VANVFYRRIVMTDSSQVYQAVAVPGGLEVLITREESDLGGVANKLRVLHESNRAMLVLEVLDGEEAATFALEALAPFLAPALSQLLLAVGTSATSAGWDSMCSAVKLDDASGGAMRSVGAYIDASGADQALAQAQAELAECHALIEKYEAALLGRDGEEDGEEACKQDDASSETTEASSASAVQGQAPDEEQASRSSGRRGKKSSALQKDDWNTASWSPSWITPSRMQGQPPSPGNVRRCDSAGFRRSSANSGVKIRGFGCGAPALRRTTPLKKEQS